MEQNTKATEMKVSTTTPCFKKNIHSYKLRNSSPILIIFDTKIPHII